jgi:hypothetical protein
LKTTDRLESAMHAQDGLFRKHDVEGTLDCLPLRLCAEELFRSVDLPLIELDVLVPRHVHAEA